MTGKSHPGDREIAKLAERQHGVVALWQLLRLGFDSGAIEARLARGRLHRVHQGVYAVGHRRLDWRGVLIAAVYAYGPEAVLSHRSAARLWGIRPNNRRDVDVTVPGRGLRRRSGLQPHCVRRLDVRDITQIDGIPVTTLPRTLLDLAEVVPKDHVIKAVTEAERQQLIDLNAIKELLARSPGRRGQRPLREILSDAVIEPRTREEFEHRFFHFCHEARLPKPKVNTAVEGYEVDLFWPHAKLIVELDSWSFHRHRKAFEDDRERDAVLLTAGYRVVRITWRQLTREPKKLEARLRALL
jgi:very-short-patch-repair endonuclease/predicted transcriptional regulator of viral defense system